MSPLRSPEVSSPLQLRSLRPSLTKVIRRMWASIVHVKDDLSSAKVTNISGTSGMTHSGRIFAAPELPVWSKDPKGKAKVDVGESDKAGLTLDDEVPVGKITEEGSDFCKKGISAEEVTEFLRIIQHSEFKVIEQLNKTPILIFFFLDLIY